MGKRIHILSEYTEYIEYVGAILKKSKKYLIERIILFIVY